LAPRSDEDLVGRAAPVRRGLAAREAHLGALLEPVGHHADDHASGSLGLGPLEDYAIVVHGVDVDHDGLTTNPVS